ncbi:YkvA family protein [Halpernia sp.]|uniref:YkvA family protein n=1 Tax=Halpernia sp. TaxID=2782209 RepID=UPI003A8F7D0C
MSSKINLAIEAFKHKGFISKLPTIARMLNSIRKRQYKPEIKNLIIPGAVLLYILSPIDIIPDWIPVIGVMDDLALVALAIPLLIKETERFLAWENEKSNNKVIDAKIVS